MNEDDNGKFRLEMVKPALVQRQRSTFVQCHLILDKKTTKYLFISHIILDVVNMYTKNVLNTLLC